MEIFRRKSTYPFTTGEIGEKWGEGHCYGTFVLKSNGSQGIGTADSYSKRPKMVEMKNI